jgi:3',5'-cyclic AMP phosphodiesterase CpdA
LFASIELCKKIQRLFLVGSVVCGLAALCLGGLPSLHADVSTKNVYLPPHSPTKKISTLKEGPTPLRFFALGDTGSGNENQKAVATAMLNQAQTYCLAEKRGCDPTGISVKGILHLGDIIYPVGDATHHADRLVTQMYKGLTDLGIPFYFSLGNHDMLTQNGQDVIQSLHLPAKGYYKVSPSPLVDFFVINTSAFNASQKTWLQSTLAQSKASWKVVFGHHPLYSTGAHGQDADLRALRKQLDPILRQYGVDAYLAGHEHNYERFATQATHANGLPYLHIVSGGGGAHLRTQRNIDKKTIGFPPTLFYDASQYHYLDLALTSQQLTIQMKNVENMVWDEVTITHPKKK